MKKKLVLAITILVIIIGGILFTVKQQVKTSKQNDWSASHFDHCQFVLYLFS